MMRPLVPRPLARRVRVPALVLVLLVPLLPLAAGCRACGGGGEQPPPPRADAAALPAAPASAVARAAERLTAVRGQASGEWVELQIAQPGDGPSRANFDRWARDSLFLSPDAMGFFHDAFARALPGWNPFFPQLLDAEALRRLDERLATVDQELETTADVARAKARWAGVSSLVAGMPDDAAWTPARAALRGTIRDLRTFCKGLRDQGERLWVLP
jgi:hypothetical protein